MSGIVKGIKKVFKKVVKVVKKIAPYVILAAAVYFTGGAALAALPAAAGATGAASATFAGGPLAGALVSSGAAITGGATTGGGIVAALGGLVGEGSLISKALGSGFLGSALSGAGQAWIGAEMLKDERDFEEKQQRQRTARYNINDSSVFGVGPQARADISTDLGAVQSVDDRGLGIRPPDAFSPTIEYQPTQLATAPTGPPRPTVGAPRQPRYRYNPETLKIDYA